MFLFVFLFFNLTFRGISMTMKFTNTATFSNNPQTVAVLGKVTQELKILLQKTLTLQ